MKYSAFISYNHRDQKWAKWLHRGLESYRVPKNLHGAEGRNGPIGAKLDPVFRDRDELAAGANLGALVQAALEQADSLIVICSPNGRRSKWVNAEIREFTKLGRRDRIFCLIVDGEPNAIDPELECIPPAIYENGASEPLAADLRPGQDSKTDSLIKLIAPLMGVKYDELRQRENARRVRQMTVFAIIASIAFLITSGLAITAYIARNEAVLQRDIARERSVTAERTVDFVKGMFTVADPSEALGSTITAREIVDRGARDYATALRNEPVVKAEIGLTLSEVYGALGLYQQSDQLVRSTKGLAKNKRATIARQQMLMGESQFRLGDYETALVSFRRSVAMARADNNAKETVLARALVGLGQSLSALDQFQEAEAILGDALTLDKAKGTSGRRDVARDYEAIALNSFYSGDFQKARPFFEKANAIRIQEEGPTSPSVSDNFGSLASIAYMEGNFDQAEKLFRSRLVIDEKVLGPKHPDVGATLNNIGRILLEKGAFNRADKLLDRAVAIGLAEKGDEHDDMSFMLSNLALSRKGLENLVDSERYFRMALSAAQRHESRTRAPILVDLASVLCRSGTASEAEQLLEIARPIMEKDYPDDPWRSALLNNVKSECLWITGQRGAARDLFRASRPELAKKWKTNSLYGIDLSKRQRILGL